ncbi:hypothetical protein MOQ_003846 [Trypanosoma cruzi marinkellei]|uniref:Uncharacterized protein n=1 Tax=Trypanosoma cruzi marinkellei TaxID=85056 RepID=K2MAX7_TRYCR|nr:hypothetical protein MOQ_003846 [Trypanosoma cruzi marinkellei]
MPFRNAVSGHAGLKAASTRNEGRASSSGSVYTRTRGAVLRKQTGKKTQRKSSTSHSPPPQEPLDMNGDNFNGGTQTKEKRLKSVPVLNSHLLEESFSLNTRDNHSPPKLLQAQDLRGDKSLQTQLQISLSPRTRKTVYPTGRRAVSPNALFVDNMNSKGNTSPTSPLSRTWNVGAIPPTEFSGASSYHDSYRDISPSVSKCRTAGPVVTEEWSRSIVQPQDEHLLYEGHVSWKKRHEEQVRRIQVVWLREQARMASRRDEEYVGGMRPVAATMPLLSLSRARSIRQQHMSSQESVALENEDIERERTVWMNERHILARGTPLLFSRPRSRPFESNRNNRSEWQKTRIDMPTNLTTMATLGMKFDVDTTSSLKRPCNSNIMITSILHHHSLNTSQDFSPNVVGNGDTPSPSFSGKNKRPVLLSMDTLPPTQRPAGGTSNGEKRIIQDEDSTARPQTNFTSSSLFSDTAAQEMTRLFDNPFFLLRSDENHERLLLAQEEHEKRDKLMQLHTTSMQSGYSLLTTEKVREESKTPSKHEFSVGVFIPQGNLTHGAAAMPSEADPVGNTRKGNKNNNHHNHNKNNNTVREAAGDITASHVLSSTVMEGERENRREAVEARYVVLDIPSRKKPAVAGRMNETSHHRRAVMEEVVGHRSTVEISKGEARQDGTTTAAVMKTRKKHQGWKETQKPKQKAAPVTASSRTTEIPHSGKETVDTSSSSPPPPPQPQPPKTKQKQEKKQEQKEQQPREVVAAVALENSSPEHKEQLQQLQHPMPRVNASPVISPVKLSRLPGSPSSPRTSKGAESGRARDAVGVWDITYPSTESLSRASSASRSPVRQLMFDEPMPKSTLDLESLNAGRKGCIKTADSGVSGTAVQTSPMKRSHHVVSTGSTPSKSSEAEFSYHEDEQDAELHEYVRFALRKEKEEEEEKQTKSGKGAEEDIAGLPGVLWLKQHRRFLPEGKADMQSVQNTLENVESDREKNNFLAGTDGALGSDEDGINQSLEEIGHYALNVKSVLTAFGNLWQTPFQEAKQRDTLPPAVQAQLLFLNHWPHEDKKDADDGSDGENDSKNVCSKSQNGKPLSVGAEE